MCNKSAIILRSHIHSHGRIRLNHSVRHNALYSLRGWSCWGRGWQRDYASCGFRAGDLILNGAPKVSVVNRRGNLGDDRSGSPGAPVGWCFGGRGGGDFWSPNCYCFASTSESSQLRVFDRTCKVIGFE